ncbi:MAG: ABC transporter ATP-binding protein, partial [Pseudanabaenaceae cyanobacterium bins.68]|nr:ABC transporter ATP-binding protein [Pseudanabaenaceae cyanobacterium bins.68]
MARSHFQQINSYLLPYRRDLFAGFAALFMVNGVGTYIPLLIRQGIDQLGADFSITQVGFYALAIFGLASLMWMMRMASRLW